MMQRATSEQSEETARETRPLSWRLVLRVYATLGRYKWLIFLGHIMLVICVVTDLEMVSYVGRLMNRGDLLSISPWGVAGVLLTLGLINRVFGTAQFLVTIFAANSGMARLRKDFFIKLQSLSKDFFDTHRGGWLVARSTGDMGILWHFTSFSFMMLTMFLITTVYSLIKIANIATILLLPTLFMCPIVLATAVWYNRRMTPAQRRARERNSQLVADMAENVRGVRVVQAFSREEMNLANFNELNLQNHNVAIRVAKLNALFMPSIDFLGILNTLLAVSFGVWLIHTGSGMLAKPLTTGDLVAYVLFANYVLWPMRMLVEAYTMALQAMAAAERIYEIMDMEPSVTDRPGAVDVDQMDGHVVFENVNFRYGPDAPAILANLDLELKPGQTTALVGATGAGKTTIASLLARFYDVSAGRILIDGRDIRDYKQDSLHHNMGIVLQDGFLFTGTIMANLRLMKPGLSDDEVVAMARSAGSHEVIMSLAQGYDTRVIEGGGTISEGQRQLISLTRALVADPRLLILDEPTSSLDLHTERSIQTAISRLLQGRTSLLIAHRLSTVENADQIVVLAKGQVVEIGTHASLTQHKGLYYRMAQQSQQSGRFPDAPPAM
jgi:ABC-type multidrug transport system fused ATPase/permease subunit